MGSDRASPRPGRLWLVTLGGSASLSGIQRLRTCSLAPPTTTRSSVPLVSAQMRQPPHPPRQDYCSKPFPCPASPQVLLWDVSRVGAVLRRPIRVVLRPIYHRYPSEALLLSVSFNADGSRLVVTSKDRRVRVLDPRTGKILQVCPRASVLSVGSAQANVGNVVAGVALQVPPGQQGSVR